MGWTIYHHSAKSYVTVSIPLPIYCDEYAYDETEEAALTVVARAEVVKLLLAESVGAGEDRATVAEAVATEEDTEALAEVAGAEDDDVPLKTGFW